MRIYKATKLEWDSSLFSTCGDYHIETSLEEFILWHHDNFDSKKFDPVSTLEECKRLAQKDHEIRVTSSLEDHEGIEQVVEGEEKVQLDWIYDMSEAKDILGFFNIKFLNGGSVRLEIHFGVCALKPPYFIEFETLDLAKLKCLLN